MLPHFIGQDFRDVLRDLNRAGYPFESDWFAPHFEFRYPVFGHAHHAGIDIEIRQAIEPWYVLGEEGALAAPRATSIRPWSACRSRSRAWWKAAT